MDIEILFTMTIVSLKKDILITKDKIISEHRHSFKEYFLLTYIIFIFPLTSKNSGSFRGPSWPLV